MCIVPIGYANPTDINSPWTAYWNAKHDLRGFKDAAGNIRIAPKFMGYTVALRFNHIMAVMEEQNGKLVDYYLLKNGKKIGHHDTYVTADMSFDCECEETIRFRDHTNDKVGFYDAHGKIIIPPIFSDASPFRNNVAVALKNAKRICWDGKPYSEQHPCEHWRWKGGQSFLIDKQNKVLIKNFEYNPKLDWHSLKISAQPSNNRNRVSYRGQNGKYYSFVDHEKDFENWLKERFLSNLSKIGLMDGTYSQVTRWKEPVGWIAEGKRTFINSNYDVLTHELQRVKQLMPKTAAQTSPGGGSATKYVITINGLNPFIYDSAQYQRYFDDCGNPKVWRYPVLNLVVEHRRKTDSVQHLFEFLKTNQGFRLISVTLRTGQLK